MIALKGYQIGENIHEGKNTLVYRALTESGQSPVIIKVLKSEYPSLEELARLKQEFEIARKLELPGVVRPVALEEFDNGLALVLEDFNGLSLSEHLKNEKLSIEWFLKIAIQLAHTLGELHNHDIIHKDIKPRNIIVNLTNNQVKLIDFGISTFLSRENPGVVSPGKLEGTLAYISPEQTGRMNRIIDNRSDFYSLGVTFYEMLTGTPPFIADDPMELIHLHIARQPRPPHELKSSIPQPLSRLIMKLLSKNAEDRYQSAYGISADLEECLKRLSPDGNISDFNIAEQDISEKFHIPQKLYGRDAELDLLLSTFEDVCLGPPVITMVSGYSGIGKSALINEIHKPIVKNKGHFIAGKYDQFKRDIPYSAITEAFKELIHLFLTESKSSIESWKKKILASLGNNGQVIVDVIPEVELIIGKQKPVPALETTEAQNRFNIVFREFVHVFATARHPLVLFLDDLQWTDIASLKLLQSILIDPGMSHLLVIGAYRSNEVDELHPLSTFLKDLDKENITIKNIQLLPLSRESAAELCADTLQTSRERVKEPVDIIYQKTNGNPFFVNEFLKTLYLEHLLNFDPARGRWVWDLEEIKARDISDNVVELMSGRIQKLPEKTQENLKLAACMGHRFDLHTLSIVSKQKIADIALHLQKALQENLVIPLEDSYKYVTTEHNDNSPYKFEFNVQYKFLHDRVQQAAYSLIGEEQKQKLHLAIGRHLLENTGENKDEKQEESIITLVNHLNQALDIITQADEKLKLAELNLAAGIKAKSAAAFDSGLNYLLKAVDLLPAKKEDHYALTLSVYTLSAELAYLNNREDLLQLYSQKTLAFARSALDKVKVYQIQILHFTALGKPIRAIQSALTILALLKVKLPENPGEGRVALELVWTKITLGRKKAHDLKKLPLMEDPEKLAAMQILISVAGSVYVARPNLLPIIMFKIVRLSIRSGNSEFSPWAYAGFGFILIGALNDINNGYEFGELANWLVEELNVPERKPKVNTLVSLFIEHWKNSLQGASRQLSEQVNANLDAGDLEYAAFAAYNGVSFRVFTGENLSTNIQEFTQYANLIHSIKQEQIVILSRTWHQLNHNLLEVRPDPGKYSGDIFDESVHLPELEETNNFTGFFFFHCARAINHYYFQEYKNAVAESLTADNYVKSAISMAFIPQHNFYCSLSMLGHYDSASPAEKKSYLKRVNTNQKILEKWALITPQNFLNKLTLVKAEKARVTGHVSRAMNFFDQAIKLSRENGFIHEEALANEISTRFYLSLDKEKIARTYLIDARYGYLRWGSQAKVKNLDKQFPHLMSKVVASEGLSFDSQITESRTDSLTATASGDTTGGLGAPLDITTVIKASQTLSGEIFLENLLKKMMRIVIENAGAERGLLILEKNGVLTIEAQGAIDEEETKILQSIPAENSDLAPLSIIEYVQRTGEAIVLGDATKIGRFTNSPYILKNKPASVLCSPITRQGKLFAIIYLENNLTTNTFTRERLDLLRILSTQAAISLENARLVTEETERQKLQKELEVARNLQLSILPNFPEDEAYEITAHMIPAESVGGDYYDYHLKDNYRWLGIGDVTGHGLNSGLMMMMAQTGFSTYLNSTEKPDTLELFVALNKTLHMNMSIRTKQNLYMTFTALRADSSGEFEHVGQHEDIMIYRKEQNKVEVIKSSGFWMGLVPDVRSMVHKSNFKLHSGDFLLLYTDGVIECRNAKGEQFDKSRLIEIIEQNATRSLVSIKDTIVRACIAHMDKMDDDITLLLIRKK